MHYIASRVNSLEQTEMTALAAKALQMKTDGVDIVDLSGDAPEIPPTAAVINAAKKALDSREPLGNGSIEITGLRAAISDALNRQGLAYKADQLLFCNGVKEALFNVIMTIVDRSDQVLIPAPYWHTYVDVVHAAEGVPVIIPSGPDDNFKITPAQIRNVCTPRTVAIILGSPANPTGAVYSEEELREIGQIIVQKDIICISDETYGSLIVDGQKRFRIAAAGHMEKEQTVIVNGFSNMLAPFGWDIAFASGPAEIIGPMSKWQQHTSTPPSPFVQQAALEAMHAGEQDIANWRKSVDERRTYVSGELARISQVTCNLPAGGFFLFPDVDAYYGKTSSQSSVNDGLALAYYLLTEGKVLVAPGVAFGAPSHLRISCACSMEKLQKGMQRLRDALAKLS